MVDLFDIRREYTQGQLDESSSASDPMTQFHAWFESYKATEPLEPIAMTLASTDESGMPWQRIVLLKKYDAQGFVFFTNYQSNKGQHFSSNPQASAHFAWLVQERQVLVQGKVDKIPREETAAYFKSRPRDSQLGAWASHQSQPIDSRAALEERYQAVQQNFEQQDIIVPEHWGGYRISPQRVEFWQGGAARLHDRIEYSLVDDLWVKQRLSP